MAATTSVVQGVDLLAIAPPLSLALVAVGVLITDPFLVRRRRILDYVSLGGVVGSLGFVAALAAVGERRTFCVPPGLAGDLPPSCSYVVDDFTVLFQALVLLAGVVVLLMAMPEIHATRLPTGEFHFLLLVSVTGALALAASRDLISLVVSLEVVSLPVFALTALRRYDGRSSEAGLKMFLVSVVSTAVMLFGISLVYGVTGAVHLDRIAGALAGEYVPQAIAISVGDARPVVGAVGIMFVLAGFAFKVAAVPFHFWAPDTYQGAPLPIAAFLSVVSKAAGFAGLVLVLVVAFWPYGAIWGPVVAVLAAATMTLGNLVALRQRHAVRLLAWSSIAQSGYMLAPLGAALTVAGGPAAGGVMNGEGAPPDPTATFDAAVAATIAYVAIYAAMNIGAFAVVAAVGRHRPRNNLEDYRGLARTNPLVGVALAFFLACLAGLPPGLAGLFAKIVVFRAAVDGSLGWLAVVMAVNTVIGLYYYLAWAATAFTGREAGVWRPVGVEHTPVPRVVGLAIGVAAVATVVLSVAPQVVLHVTPIAVSATG